MQLINASKLLNYRGIKAYVVLVKPFVQNDQKYSELLYNIIRYVNAYVQPSKTSSSPSNCTTVWFAFASELDREASPDSPNAIAFSIITAAARIARRPFMNITIFGGK